jgi:hypothetical protein
MHIFDWRFRLEGAPRDRDIYGSLNCKVLARWNNKEEPELVGRIIAQNGTVTIPRLKKRLQQNGWTRRTGENAGAVEEATGHVTRDRQIDKVRIVTVVARLGKAERVTTVTMSIIAVSLWPI